MTPGQALLLGAIQGLTEFLPISSSAHLLLARALFGWSGGSLAFDVALHAGTLLAVLAYFRHDWIRLARGVARALGERRLNPHALLAAKLAAASVPAAAAGALLEETVASSLRSPWLAIVMLAAVGVLLAAADRRARGGPALEEPGFGAALLIGLAQALALVPGTSRSGITMLAGLGLGLNRASAARFSFLLSAPILLGAALFEWDAALRLPWEPLAAGVVASALSGGLAIGFLLRHLAHHSFLPFAWYRIGLAALSAAVLLARGA
jgi:undecaprenyl-diphosphatase